MTGHESTESRSVTQDIVRRSIKSDTNFSVSIRSRTSSNKKNSSSPTENINAIPTLAQVSPPLPDIPLQSPTVTSRSSSIISSSHASDDTHTNPSTIGPSIELGQDIEEVEGIREPEATPTPPNPMSSTQRKTFVGGFLNGLKKLPRVVVTHGAIEEKRRIIRRVTFGPEGIAANVTGMATRNTIPRYVSTTSSPTARPSNPQETPKILPFAGFGTPLSNNRLRHHPSFLVTPPSVVPEQDEAAQTSIQPTDPSQSAEVIVEPPRNPNTVTVYDFPEREDLPLADNELPRPRPSFPRYMSYIEPPSNQSFDTQPPQLTRESSWLIPSPVEPPAFPLPPPATDYPQRMLWSPPATHTTMTVSLISDPPPERNPIKRLLYALRRLPWMSLGRTTVDYIPGGPRGEQGGVIKKPMVSWYRRTLIRSGLDFLSSTNPTRTSTSTPSIPIFSSPTPRTPPNNHRPLNQRRRRQPNQHRSGNNNNLHSHQHRSSTTSTNTADTQQPENTNNPIMPAIYIYALPFPYPYPATQPPAPLRPRRTHSSSRPRGPSRSHRPSHRTPHVHVPYQSPPPPPPIYLIPQPMQGNGAGWPVAPPQNTNHGPPSSVNINTTTPLQPISPVWPGVTPPNLNQGPSLSMSMHTQLQPIPETFDQETIPKAPSQLSSRNTQVRSSSRIQKWIDCSSRVSERLDEMIGNSESQYLERLYSRYVSQLKAGHDAPEVLEAAIDKLGKVQRTIERCSVAILQDAGEGPEFETVEEKAERVRRVRDHVEAMLCEAMVDPSNLVNAHTARKLSYQS